MKTRKKILLFFILIFTLGLISWIGILQIPLIQDSLRSWIEKQIYLYTPLKASLEKIEISLLPLGFEVHGLRLEPKKAEELINSSNSLKNSLGANQLPSLIFLETGTLYLNSSELLKGRLSVKNIHLDQLNVEVTLNPEQPSSLEGLDLAPFFQLTSFIEGSTLTVTHSRVLVKKITSSLDTQYQGVHLNLSVEKNKLLGSLSCDSVDFYYDTFHFSVQASLQALLTKEEIHLKAIHIHNEGLNLESEFKIFSLKTLFKKPKITGFIQAQFQSENPYPPLLQTGFKIQGSMDWKASFDLENHDLRINKSSLQTQDLKMDIFRLGNLHTEFSFLQKTWLSSLIQIQEPHIHLELTETSFSWEKFTESKDSADSLEDQTSLENQKDQKNQTNKKNQKSQKTQSNQNNQSNQNHQDRLNNQNNHNKLNPVNHSAPQNHHLSFKTQVEIKTLQLQNLFKNLNLKEIPVWLNIQGKSPCSGSLYPRLRIQCQPDLVGQNLIVQENMTAITQPIVNLSSFRGKGQIEITNQFVRYQSTLALQENSTGSSEGIINYDTGFDIQFEGNSLQLKDVGAIAGLNFLGEVQVKGSTQGNSHTADFALNIKTKDFAFENFNLGSTSAHLSYHKGVLNFQSLQAQLPSSEVTGSLKIDLLKSNLSLDLTTKKIFGEDLTFVFKQYLPEKFLSQGNGYFHFKAQGPFDWKQWDGNLDFKLSKPVILNEYFDEIKVQFKVQERNLTMDPSYASKGGYRIALTGFGHLEQDSQIQVSAKHFPLEYIDNVSLLSASISGLLSFDGTLVNPLGQAHWTSHCEINSLTLNEQSLESFQFDYTESLKERYLRFQYGHQDFLSELRINKTLSQKSSFKAQAHELDSRPLFTLIGASALMDDYHSSTSFNLEYSFDPKDFLKGTGDLIFTDIFISRLGTHLKLKKPTHFKVQEGHLTFSQLSLTGSLDQNFEVSAEGSLYENFKTSLRFNTELSLFHPFLPFFDDFRGRLVGHLILSQIPKDPQFFGFFKVHNGQIQFRGLHQSLSQISLESQLQNKQLQILSMKGNLGQGQVEGSGEIIFHKIGHIDIDIPLSFQNNTIEPEEGLRFKTSGNLTLKGSWFPYKLDGTLNILEGLISKDFESSDSVSIRRSSLLPKMILKKALDPIILNVKINAEPIALRNTLIDGSALGSVEVLGSPNRPEISGQVRIQQHSRIFFRENEFRVEQGLINLDGNPDLNPNLLFSALARIDRYDVTLNIQGSLNEPVIRLSSQPVLPESDLVSLLALGQLTNEVERRLQAPSSQTQAEAQIGSVLLQNIPLFKKAQKVAGVNIQISSGFDPEQNAEFRRISISKRLNTKARVVAATGDYGFREFKLEYLLTQNLSAIGRFKQQDFIPNSINLERQNRSDSILGLDLEFRKEFR
jgi:translocation and assembly module TamB